MGLNLLPSRLSVWTLATLGLACAAALVAGMPLAAVARGMGWLALALAGFVLYSGARRIRSTDYATSRRNAYRVNMLTSVEVDGVQGELIDVSIGGAAVRFPLGALPSSGLVEFQLPGAAPVKMEMVRLRSDGADVDLASLRANPTDWAAFRTMSLWMFHTPSGAISTLPPGVPVIATLSPRR